MDKFVISEATETFSGLKKPLYYEENKYLFNEFADKIIHVVVDDTPEGGTHERDTFQKNAVTRGLSGCKDEDIILFSDLDEIPNPDKIREILQNFQDDKIYHFAQRLFYCYLNMEEVSGNGNGFTINLNSFKKTTEDSALTLALFTTVQENTLLKNVRVNIYQGGQINASDQISTEITK